MPSSSTSYVLRAVLALALVAGCSTASPGDPDGGGSPGSPDGAATTPDAPVSTPDAPVSTPDSMVSTPDAIVSVPDAMISVPDAMVPPDAAVPPDAMVPPDASTGPCDPVAQTGCTGTDKCTWNIDTLTTECAANGTINSGNPCSYASGIDNCKAGDQCINGACLEICSQNPNSCPGSDSCTLFNETFDDLTEVGICQPGCDPLEPGCSAGEGCYLSVTSGEAICSGPSATGTQDDACTYLNDCNPDYGCLLNDAPTNATTLTCAYYCDSTASGGPSCTDPGGPGSAYQCCEIRTFYNNSGNVPAGIGMCVETAVWGACP